MARAGCDVTGHAPMRRRVYIAAIHGNAQRCRRGAGDSPVAQAGAQAGGRAGGPAGAGRPADRQAGRQTGRWVGGPAGRPMPRVQVGIARARKAHLASSIWFTPIASAMACRTCAFQSSTCSGTAAGPGTGVLRRSYGAHLHGGGSGGGDSTFGASQHPNITRNCAFLQCPVSMCRVNPGVAPHLGNDLLREAVRQDVQLDGVMGAELLEVRLRYRAGQAVPYRRCAAPSGWAECVCGQLGCRQEARWSGWAIALSRPFDEPWGSWLVLDCLQPCAQASLPLRLPPCKYTAAPSPPPSPLPPLPP